MQVVVLGGSGMLGAMVLGCLTAARDHDVLATGRTDEARAAIRRHFPTATVVTLDAEDVGIDALVATLAGADWVINAIGVIKPYIHDDNPREVERAIRVNALFPHRLARAAERIGARVLQIATDCVYSASRGAYVETDEHDPHDVYGKSKSLGEVTSPAVHHVRCSIIGPELKGHASLLDWFVRQPPHATVNGFVNHRWNGVTTLHFGRICLGIIASGVELPHLQHIVPADSVSKADLLRCLATAYDRRDVTVVPVNAAAAVDRTLATRDDDSNRRVWQAAGHPHPPAVAAMVNELVASREWPIFAPAS